MDTETSTIEPEITSETVDSAPEPSAAPEPEPTDLDEAIRQSINEVGGVRPDETPQPDTTPEAKPDEQEARSDDEPSQPSTPAPNGWPAEYRAAFEASSPEVQAAWQDHAGKMLAAIQGSQQDVAFARGIRGIFTEEHRAQMRDAGVTNEADAVRMLAGLHDFADRDPVGYLRYVAQQAGVNLAELAATDAHQGHGSDARIDFLISERNQERARAQAEQAERQRQVDEAAEQERQAVQSTISDFANAKAEDGTLAHPHFNEVQQLMASFLTSGTHDDMKSAYDAAIRAHPTLGPQLLEKERRAGEEAAKKAAAAERAKKARLAKASAQPTAASVANADLDDILSDAIRHHVPG